MCKLIVTSCELDGSISRITEIISTLIIYTNVKRTSQKKQTNTVGTSHSYYHNFLLESLHHSRPMLDTGSSSGVELFQVFMVLACWVRLAGIPLSVHPHIRTQFVHPHFCTGPLHRPVPSRRRFRLYQVDHASLEPRCSDFLGLKESFRLDQVDHASLECGGRDFLGLKESFRLDQVDHASLECGGGDFLGLKESFRLDQVGHASLKCGGSDFMGLKESFRLDQVGHASPKCGGSDSLGLKESLCVVVWSWLDQRVSL